MGKLNLADETIRITIPTEGFKTHRPSTELKKKDGDRKSVIQTRLNDTEYEIYAQFMNSVYDAVVIADWEGSILDANTRAEDFFRCGSINLCAQTIFDIFYGFNAPMLERVRRNVDVEKRYVLIEAFCCRIDGTMFPAEIAVSGMKLGKKEVASFFVRDITRRKEDAHKLEQAHNRLAQNKRLEAAGRVAGSIAHDFNNLLTPLLGYPSLIKTELPEGSQARNDLDIIADTAQRMSDINQQLLMLSQRGHGEQRLINLNTTIKNLIDLVRRNSRDSIEIKLELSDDLFNMMGAEEQLLRAIQNLYQNAIDAMGDKGTLTIKTENAYIDQHPGNGGMLLKSGDYIKLSIKDTGHGIPSEIRERIFEPFFSTRKTGAKRRGVGLGMSIVFGIIEDHKGRIEVESEVGRGTTFTIFLPAARRDVNNDVDPALTAREGESILVVDDDELQVNMLKQLLECLGYAVLTATKGEDAVLIMEKHKLSGRFPDLAVIDMVMGSGMDGAEIYQIFKQINPKQKAIFISGYRESHRVKAAQAIGGGAFLMKPIYLTQIASAIRKELDKPKRR